MKILITGGAGFVGSNLARSFLHNGVAKRVVCFDNLKRRGSELNLPVFRREGVEFVHGDVRSEHDLWAVDGEFDFVIDASAEASVLAGLNSSARSLIETNLQGTINCLEFCRERAGGLIFLSTSRVYSLEALKRIPLKTRKDRFVHGTDRTIPGLTAKGVSEKFPTDTARSLYGATKLASELFVQEYCDSFGMKAVINRCGVIAGPGQFGKVDQGVFTLWVANHYFGKPLTYTGFGGKGLQVRDLLHPADLTEVLVRQMSKPAKLDGAIYNLGGGTGVSTSLRELTAICREVTGRTVEIGARKESAAVDVPYYVTDFSLASRVFGWKPLQSVRDIVSDIHQWIKAEEPALRSVFGM